MKFTVQEVCRDFGNVDYNCYWHEIKGKDRIIFDDDKDGNGLAPYLVLRFFKNYAKFVGGSHLYGYEKLEKYHYLDDLCEYVDLLNEFVVKYFDSIEVKYVRK